MPRTTSRWAVALRIARRSALISWGRSLLIVLLIAAPISGLTAAAVVVPSMQSTLPERLQNTLGRAQAKLTVVGEPGTTIRQGVEGGEEFLSLPAKKGEVSGDNDPRSLLPAGSDVIAISRTTADFAKEGGTITLDAQAGPSWSPVLQGGPYELLSGHRPRSRYQVLLSPAAAQRLHTGVGAEVTMTAPTRRTLEVVGTARDRSLPSSAQTVFTTGSLLPSAQAMPRRTSYWVVSSPVSWPLVRKMNAIGTTVLSREVALDPPADATRVVFPEDGDPGLGVAALLGAVFAMLEVALLAGAAFLVGARLQQRTLAIIASVGADRFVLQRIVAAGGLVLGTIGGAVGVAAGVGLGISIIQLTSTGRWTQYPGLHLNWPLLVAIAGFGVLVGWFSSSLPARAASRVDVIRALRGARPPQRTGRRPMLGVLLLVIGTAMTIAAALRIRTVPPSSVPALLKPVTFASLALGPVLVQVGVLLCAGLILRVAARLTMTAPVAIRLATRDSARNLGRAVPAVAAVTTTAFVAVFVMCLAASASLQHAAEYMWTSADVGGAVAGIGDPAGNGPSNKVVRRWKQILADNLPVRSMTVLDQTPYSPDSGPDPSHRSRRALPQVQLPAAPSGCTALERRSRTDERCGLFSTTDQAKFDMQLITSGSSRALELLLGHTPSNAALNALKTGGAVALRSDIAPNGTARIAWYTPKQIATAKGGPVRVTELKTAVNLPTNPVGYSLFISPATAAHLKIRTVPSQVRLTFTRPPTQDEIDSANIGLSAVLGITGGNWVQVEAGPTDDGDRIAWYALLASLVIAITAGATAVGLARVDGRADDLTLASLGAPRTLRSAVAAVQALLICGVGGIIGAAAGLLPAIAFSTAFDTLPFNPPVVQLVLLVIGVPALVAGGAWALSGRRRADLSRRIAIA